MTFKELKLRSNPNRPVINQLIDYEEFCNVSNVSTFKNKDNSTMISEIAVQELKKLIDSNSESFVLIDVRNVNERQIAHISGSVLVPLASIEDGTGIPQIRSLIENKRLIVHCKMGGRSIKALEILEKFGIVGTNLKGGINAWSQQIDVSIPQY